MRPHEVTGPPRPASTLLLRAATLTGATFSELLPGTLADDGAAALLRFAT